MAFPPKKKGPVMGKKKMNASAMAAAMRKMKGQPKEPETEADPSGGHPLMVPDRDADGM